MDVDLKPAQSEYRAAAAAVHPDRWQTADPTHSDAAEATAAAINDAWAALQHPVSRAELLVRARAPGMRTVPKRYLCIQLPHPSAPPPHCALCLLCMLSSVVKLALTRMMSRTCLTPTQPC